MSGYQVGRHVYAVTTNTDLTEGRGSSVHLAYFVRRSDAERYAVGKGVMGTPATVTAATLPPLPRVYETWEEYEEVNRESVRARALAKLSKEERDALGLI